MSVSCQEETHALRQLGTYCEPSETSNATNTLCSRGLPAGEPLESEGDHLLKHHHPAVSFAICAKPGWSACRYRSIIALFSGLASCSARTNIAVYPSRRAPCNHFRRDTPSRLHQRVPPKFSLASGRTVVSTAWGEKLPPYQPCPSCRGTGIRPKPVKVWRRRKSMRRVI